MKNTTQKKYKDTIFRMLFKEPENGLSLYNGLKRFSDRAESGGNYVKYFRI